MLKTNLLNIAEVIAMVNRAPLVMTTVDQIHKEQVATVRENLSAILQQFGVESRCREYVLNLV